MKTFTQWVEQVAAQQNANSSGDPQLDKKMLDIINLGGDISKAATQEMQLRKKDPKATIWLQDLLKKGSKPVPGQAVKAGV